MSKIHWREGHDAKEQTKNWLAGQSKNILRRFVFDNLELVRQNTAEAKEKLTTLYLKALQELPKECAGDVLSESFMVKHHVTRDENVSVINGSDVSLKLLNFKQPSSSCKDFRFYLINSLSRKKPIRRLIECRHPVVDPSTGEAKLGYPEVCTTVQQDLSKFFDHLRVHTNERPFVCTHPLCAASFA